MSMSQDKFFGRCRYLSSAGGVTLEPGLARYWSLSATIAGAAFALPVATKLPLGGITIGVFNIGANSLNIIDRNATVIATVPAGKAAFFCLIGNTTTQGAWVTWTRTIGGGDGTPLRLLTALIVGGTGTLTTHTRFDTSTATWGGGTPAPDDHAEGAFLSAGGKANLVGNFALGSKSTLNHELNEAGAWATRAALGYQVGRTMGAGVLGHRIVFGGDGTPNVSEYRFDAWTALEALPIDRNRGTAQSVGQKVIIMPGDPVDVPNIAYDQPANLYHTCASGFTAARRSLSSFAINAKVYAIGGRNDAGPVRYATNEEYDPVTNAWTTRAALGVGARYGGAAVGGNASGAYFGGRDATDTPTADASFYIADAWTTLPSLPAARTEIDNQGTAL